ncbi:MAG: asparagine synthase (glutamine-hydrolyzing) [Actinobacteria bacterium]|nr:asparagine synthase (glutamine-hydrolyzing) [Actinomycetota bacterium]MCA1720942.1 asparagine synthase (glutamine-hydrolyzing) [Actinomycetota bacterium]
MTAWVGSSWSRVFDGDAGRSVCGVAGLLGPSATPSVPDPGLQHRGPDAHGRLTVEVGRSTVHLVHQRLAIQDLSDKGAQPFESGDGRRVLLYNGEIYNYPQLRRECEARGDVFRSDMDGEVVLHLWAREGARALDRLNGIYALAVVDQDRDEVVLARDPMGVKPLHVAEQDGRLWFASELSALARMGAPLGRPSTVGLAQFLTFLWVPQPHTPYEGARSLCPGEVLTWRDGQTTGDVVRYAPQEQAPTAESLLDLVSGQVGLATRRQLLSDVPVGLMASGGVDSSLLWWAAGSGVERVYTIEWGREAGTERLDEDASAVRQLQQRFGTQTLYVPGGSAEQVTLPPSGDLFADPAYELTREIARTAQADGCKVLLAGQGGDELFAGYRRHSVARALERVRLGRAGHVLEDLLGRVATGRVGIEYAGRLSRALAEPDPFRAYMQLCSYSTAAERADALGCTQAEVRDDAVWAEHRDAYDRQPSDASFLRKVMAVDQEVYLPGLGLAYTDRAGMEFGVEVRVPWLDLELVHWSRQLPDQALVRRGRGKWLTKSLAERELGQQLAHRAKRGFAAPARLVHRGDHAAGERRHRQGSYFARARNVLDAHLLAV